MRPDSPIASTFSASRGRQDFRRRNHHAKIDNLVIVAGKHHADDILANVVHVALDSRHQDLARGRALAAAVLRFSSSMYGNR